MMQHVWLRSILICLARYAMVHVTSTNSILVRTGCGVQPLFVLGISDRKRLHAPAHKPPLGLGARSGYHKRH
jgi:hypothetical protein